MGSLWTIASIICMMVAAVFLLRENYDAAFVSAALGAISWFLNYRARIRQTIVEETEPILDEQEALDEDNEEQ